MNYMEFYDESSKNPKAIPAPKQEPEEEQSAPVLPPHAENE